jgi:hypothetical protein
MPINPLSIPGYSQPQTLDFSPLAQLPQVFRQAQQNAARRAALGSLGRGAGARDVSMRLAQAGDLQGAMTLANLERATELTPSMKEYNYARSQGFPGSFVEFRTLLRGANGLRIE